MNYDEIKRGMKMTAALNFTGFPNFNLIENYIDKQFK